jgi:P27 family predicted phage terminase small subunit
MPIVNIFMQNKPGPKSKESAKALDGRPVEPKYLDKIGRQHWKELTSLLHDAGFLTSLDADAIGQYCMLYSRWIEAEKNIAIEGCVITAVNGYKQKNPWYEISVSCSKDMKSCWDMFGLTARGRTKLSIEKAEPIDPKWAFLNEQS